MNAKETFCEVMPVIEKASPLIAALLGGCTSNLVIGFLAVLVNCNPDDTELLLQKLKEDKDLFAKIKNLESTHGKWLDGE